MVTRFLLAGAVACLGLDLPSSADLERWIGRGSAWCYSRLDQVERELAREIVSMNRGERPRPVEEGAFTPQWTVCSADSLILFQDPLFTLIADRVETPDLTPAPELEPARPEVFVDRRFVQIVEAMSGKFAAPGPVPPEARELLAPSPTAGPQPEIAVYDIAVYGQELAERLNRESEGLETDQPQRAELFARTVRSNRAATRLAVAMKLTKQAFQAWMGVLSRTDAPAEVAAATE